jgi:hypothetical protein
MKKTIEQVNTTWGVLVLCNSRNTAARLHPQYAVISKVDGGYLVFESRSDYEGWKQQK